MISRFEDSKQEEIITMAMDAQQMSQNAASRKRSTVAAAKNLKKKTKKAPTNDSFEITKDIYDWYKNNTIYQKIDGINTEAAKDFCDWNRLPCSGAKYVLRDRLVEHCKLAEFREDNNLRVTLHDVTTSITINDNADDDTISTTSIIQDFATNKMTYASACKLYRKHIFDAKSSSTQAARLKTTIAASRGMDYHLLKAITGKDCKKYNGSRGEEGIELQEEICRDFADLYDYIKGRGDKRKDELLAELLDFCQKNDSSKCEAYGFYRYDHFIKNKL